MPSRPVPLASASAGLRLLGGAAGLLATAAGAKAGEVVFTPAPSLTVTDDVNYTPFTFELTTGIINGGSDSLQVGFYNTTKPQIVSSNPQYYDDSGSSYLTYGFATSVAPADGAGPKPTLTKYGLHDTINSDSFTGRWTANTFPQGAAMASGWGQGFVGLSYTPTAGSTYYGWAEIAYDETADSLTLLSFGYNDSVNTASMTPGTYSTAIPEPATTALVGALLAGSAALFLRRRRAAAA